MLTLWYCEATQVPADLLIDLPASQAARIRSMTNPQMRAQRLLAWWLRNRMLAEMGSLPPDKIAIHSGAGGKPHWDGPGHFNLSHTRGCVAVAFSACPVGVDVERLDRQANWRAVARRSFSREEINLLGEKSSHHLALRLWSAREAWAKATGSGVSGFAGEPPFSLKNERWMPAYGSFWQTCLREHLLSLAVPQQDKLELRAYSLELLQDDGRWTIQKRACSAVGVGELTTYENRR